MIHVVAAEKRAKEDSRQAFGQQVGNFDSYAEALRAVGEQIDGGTGDQAICFYLYEPTSGEQAEITWTLVASLY